MNPLQKTAPVLNKRLVLLTALCVASVFVVKAINVLGEAQSPAPGTKERKFTTKQFKDMPLVVETRNLDSATWLRDLEISVKNVSKKPIYYILAYLIFPDDKVPSGEVGIRLTFGVPENIRIKRIANPEDVHLAPGESYTFTIPQSFRRGFEARHRKYADLDKNILLRFALISFGDGTGFEVGEPKDLRGTKSSNPVVSEGRSFKKKVQRGC